MKISEWNNLIKPSKEVEVTARNGDLVIEIGGIVYLLMTDNGTNNVVCFRRRKSHITTLASFVMYRHWLLAQGIEYIRVEGNKRRYGFLAKIAEREGYHILKELRKDRNVYYIRLI